MPDPYAHRGLWSADGPPENSVAAFDAAAAAGLGIELDVQLSKDGVPVVFHDPMLDRMTPADGAVWNVNEEELVALPLAGSDETVPTLSAVARRLPAGTPVLVELKPSPGEPVDYLRAVELALFGTAIDAAVMSFTPALNVAAQMVMPSRKRGVLAPPKTRDASALLASAKALGASYLAVRHEQVDRYITPRRTEAGEGAAAAAEDGEGLPLVTWTVDTEAAFLTVREASQGVIFEHLDLALVRG